MMTERQLWFREIFAGLRPLDEDAVAAYLVDEDRRTEEVLAAGPLNAEMVRHIYAQKDALGLVLRGRLHLEELLEAIIAKKFKYGDVLLHGRLSFSAKMDILRASNAIDLKTYRDLVQISRLRNAFAHHLSSSLNISEVGGFSDCAALKAVAQKFETPEARAQIALFVFRQVLLQLLLRLALRHKLIGQNNKLEAENDPEPNA